MKKVLLIISFLCLCVISKAQIVGGIEYKSPFSNAPSQGQYSQPQQRVVSTTAYSFDSYNNTYIKHPIKVIEYYEHGRMNYMVVEVCQSTGYGVQWVKLNSGVPVSACMPMLSNNPLESQFTHKANVMGVIYYFDL